MSQTLPLPNVFITSVVVVVVVFHQLWQQLATTGTHSVFITSVHTEACVTKYRIPRSVAKYRFKNLPKLLSKSRLYWRITDILHMCTMSFLSNNQWPDIPYLI